VRFDFMYRSMAEGVVAIPVTSVLTQLHVYL
jgi:hypothetical protein